jgi:hypothetical protein
MPYCEKHNEVYNATECPVCAGGADDSSAERSTENADTGSAGGIDGMVNDIVDSAMDGIDDSEDDVVIGSQTKDVSETNVTEIDQSTTTIDRSTDVTDESTTVSDSVIKDSEIGAEGGSTEVDDSVVSGSRVGNEGRHSTVDSGGSRAPEEPQTEPADGRTGSGATPGGAGGGETKHCLFCGDEIPARAGHCPACGEELPDD